MENFDGLDKGKGRPKTFKKSRTDLIKEDKYRERQDLERKHKGEEKVENRKRNERGENRNFQDDDFE